MDTEHRFSEIEDRLSRIEQQLSNIEYALSMNPNGMHPLDSERLDEIRDRITVVELASGVKG